MLISDDEKEVDFLSKKLKYFNEQRKIIELESTIRYLINTEYVSGSNLKINGGLDF